MRGRDFDTRGAITYTFSGQVIETQPTIPVPPGPEPPVTPKVIATINVFENPQKIVGVHTDAETGDSIVTLPKSFEVDGIPQPLDAIDTKGYLGSYTFETLGEHTITYEFDNPTIIPAYQFVGVPIVSVQLPVGITSIDSEAFSDVLFTNIEMPESVTSIGDRAFAYNYKLSSITINATTAPTLGENAFDSTHDCPIYVPDGSVDAYKTAWPQYASRIKPLSQKFFVKLTVQDYLNYDPVGEPRDIELEGSGELTHKMIFDYLSLYTDAEYGDLILTLATSIVCGELCTSIGNYLMAAANDDESGILHYMSEFSTLRTFAISSTVANIGRGIFENFEDQLSPNITIHATTPPTLGNGAFNYTNNCPIYVPSESVQAYKTAWPAYADRIQAIS